MSYGLLQGITGFKVCLFKAFSIQCALPHVIGDFK